MKKRSGTKPKHDYVALCREASAARDQLVVRLRRAESRNKALGEAASAAAAMLDANQADGARLILTASRRLYIDGIREDVAYGPGGIWSVAAQTGSKSDG